MRFWPLLWSNLKRRKARTVFTLLSIAVAFVLFSYLAAIKVAFGAGVEVANASRLLTVNKVSIIQPLPVAYKDEIARTPGVAAVTIASWFGGIYQNPNTSFQGVFQAPVDPESFLAMYPEIQVPPEQKKAWVEDREGVLVGETTAKRYGWKVGDRVPIQGTIWRKKDGSKVWEFNVRGIYTGERTVDRSWFLFHYDYFDEARQYGQGIVGWYILRIADPSQSADVAKRIDKAFANSPAETSTMTEKALAQSSPTRWAASARSSSGSWRPCSSRCCSSRGTRSRSRSASARRSSRCSRRWGSATGARWRSCSSRPAF